MPSLAGAAVGSRDIRESLQTGGAAVAVNPEQVAALTSWSRDQAAAASRAWLAFAPADGLLLLEANLNLLPSDFRIAFELAWEDARKNLAEVRAKVLDSLDVALRWYADEARV